MYLLQDITISRVNGRINDDTKILIEYMKIYNLNFKVEWKNSCVSTLQTNTNLIVKLGTLTASFILVCLHYLCNL